MTEISVDQLRDRTVYGPDSKKIGKVERIFLDPKTDDPNFFTVATGAGEHVVAVSAVELDKSKVKVPFDKDTVEGAPSFDLEEGLETSDQDKVLKYYESSEASDKRSKQAARQADAGKKNDTDRAQDDDQDSDSDRDETEGVVEEEGSMVRRAERLDVSTEWEETGEARLSKRVVTTTETVEVPLQREELVIEREPLSDEEAREGGDLSEEEEVIVLREERAVVEKEVVGVEKVTVGKRTLSETETISADVKEEKIEIVNGAEDEDRS